MFQKLFNNQGRSNIYKSAGLNENMATSAPENKPAPNRNTNNRTRLNKSVSDIKLNIQIIELTINCAGSASKC